MARWHYNYAPVYDQLEITLMFCCYSIFPSLRWHLFTWSLKATSCSNADNWLSWYESKDRCFVKSVLCDYWNRKALCSTVIWLLMNNTTNSSSVIFFQALPSSCCCLQVFFLNHLQGKLSWGTPSTNSAWSRTPSAKCIWRCLTQSGPIPSTGAEQSHI